jgi:hypothetical protein
MENIVLDLLGEKLIGKTIQLFLTEYCIPNEPIYYEWEHFAKKEHHIEQISKGIVKKIEIEEFHCGDLSNEDVFYKEGVLLFVEVEGNIAAISLTLSEPLNII